MMCDKQFISGIEFAEDKNRLIRIEFMLEEIMKELNGIKIMLCNPSERLHIAPFTGGGEENAGQKD
jgi:hypothetical protein